MTIEETRQLGIEFERRVQTMIPEKELADKLDTDTIFSFLNQYQDKYIHDIYYSLDKIPSGTKISAHVESLLQSLIREKYISISSAAQANLPETGRQVTYPLPEQFYLYLRSTSKVNSTFRFKKVNRNEDNTVKTVPNQLVSQTDAQKFIETPHDDLRILRNPIAVLGKYELAQPTITVIYDRYTTPLGINIMYYAEPKHFDVMTNTACELPMEAFEDLVSGAVDLYVQYVAGAEARKKQMDEAVRQQQRKNNNEE